MLGVFIDWLSCFSILSFFSLLHSLAIHLEQLRHALAFRHLGGEPVGSHHSSVVLAMSLQEFFWHERRGIEVRRAKSLGTRLLHHLRLAYPQGGGGYGDGEVVDFYAKNWWMLTLIGLLKASSCSTLYICLIISFSNLLSGIYFACRQTY